MEKPTYLHLFPSDNKRTMVGVIIININNCCYFSVALFTAYNTVITLYIGKNEKTYYIFLNNSHWVEDFVIVRFQK